MRYELELNEKFLEPIYDNANSFYTKARYAEYTDQLRLYSYDSLVCIINKKTNYFKLNGTIDEDELLSNTTLRHIKEFLKQFLYKENKAITKADLKKHIVNNIEILML